LIVSKDLHSTQIIISLDVAQKDAGTKPVRVTLKKVRDTAYEMFDGLSNVYVTGLPLIDASISDSMTADVIILIPLVVAVLVFVLVFSFRKLLFVTLPLLTVIISSIWAVGAMPLLDVKFNILSSVLPVILIAVGSAYGIHLVSHYRDKTKLLNNTVEEHRELVLSLVRTVIKPVFLAALTTFAGFVSFCFTALPPIKEFGLFISFGIIAAFLVAITLIPALLLIRGPRSVTLPEKQTNKLIIDKAEAFDFDNKLAGFLSGVENKKALVLFITAVVMAVSIYGFSLLVVDNAFIEFFREDTEISRSDRFIREHFAGSTQLTISVEADNTDIILSPEVLSAVDGLSVYLSDSVPLVGKVFGFTDMIKRINQMFNIDESPDGLRPNTENITDNTDTTAFGSFGFGLGDFGVTESFTASHEKSPNTEKNVTGLSQYSVEDLFNFLNTAASKNPNMSGNAVMRELERLVNYNGYSYYEIPASPERYGKTTPEELKGIIANYLVLVSGSENNYSNDPLEPTAIKMTLQIRSQWEHDLKNVLKEVNAYIDANFPKNVRVVIGGGATRGTEITNLVVHSQIISIIVSILSVFVIIA